MLKGMKIMLVAGVVMLATACSTNSNTVETNLEGNTSTTTTTETTTTETEGTTTNTTTEGNATTEDATTTDRAPVKNEFNGPEPSAYFSNLPRLAPIFKSVIKVIPITKISVAKIATTNGLCN